MAGWSSKAGWAVECNYWVWIGWEVMDEWVVGPYSNRDPFVKSWKWVEIPALQTVLADFTSRKCFFCSDLEKGVRWNRLGWCRIVYIHNKIEPRLTPFCDYKCVPDFCLHGQLLSQICENYSHGF